MMDQAGSVGLIESYPIMDFFVTHSPLGFPAPHFIVIFG
jgi:hypothetical protein